jgi:RNA polymerase sigma-70 factor (ECF subfamily)
MRTSPEREPHDCRCDGGCAAAIAALRPSACWPDSPALGELCRGCWSVVYRSVRGRLPASDAEDLTQSFFLRAIEKRSLGQARMESGCFRPYLMAAVRHFVANERARQRAEKRGGGAELSTFDDDRSSGRRSLTSSPPGGPEDELERVRLDRALTAALAALLGSAGKEAQRQRVEALLPHLEGLDRAADGARLAGELGMSETAVRVALHRLRRRLGRHLAAAGYPGAHPCGSHPLDGITAARTRRPPDPSPGPGAAARRPGS